MYSYGVKEFVGGKDAPVDYKSTARSCYIASVIYAALAIFAIYQVFLNYRDRRKQLRSPMILTTEDSMM
jgi:hypothetical protein